MATKKSMVFEGVAVTLLLLLLFLMLAMVSENTGEEVIDAGTDPYVLAGQDNMLYLSSGNSIYAVDGQGKRLWDYTPDGPWDLCDRWVYPSGQDNNAISQNMGPVWASDGGVLYVYLMPSPEPTVSSPSAISGKLAAISPAGDVFWSLPLDCLATMNHDNPQDTRWYPDVSILAAGGRVYAYHGGNETAIGKDGAVLWNVGGVAGPAAVDPAGRAYCLRAQDPSVVEAYGPDGALLWRTNMTNPLHASLPLYNGGLVYVPASNGLTAIYENGTVAWAKAYGEDDFTFRWPGDAWAVPSWFDEHPPVDMAMYPGMPFDSQGNAYLVYPGTRVAGYRWLYLVTIAPNGTELSRQYVHEYTYVAARDGTGYATNATVFQGIPVHEYVPATNVSQLQNDTLFAYDMKSGTKLWEYKFSTDNPAVITLDQDNVRTVGLSYDRRNSSLYFIPGNPGNYSVEELRVYPGDGIVYAIFHSYCYRYPVVFGRSQCAYTDGLYAFDGRGRLVWQKALLPSDMLTVQATHNGSIVYWRPDGRVGITNTGLAAGFTLTALAYLILRFVCLGAVARARARFSDNENRRRVMDYIAGNPGSTLYEVARGAGLNLGTVRYHVLILGMNHKIASSRMDGKYIRYFNNSNTYNKDEQLVFSLMRRDAMRRILELIQRRPGVSNAEISEALGISVSVVSRSIKELSEKGVVDREPEEARGAYFIREAYSAPVADAVRRLQGQ